MAGEITSQSPEVRTPVRNPLSVAVLSVATLGIYTIIWYRKTNREMRDFGESHGDRELASIKPWFSVLALTIGAVIVVPKLVSLLRTVRRVQAVERLTFGSSRSAAGLNVGVAASAVLPIGGSARGIGPLVALGGFFALVVSITLMQVRLNAAWRTAAATNVHRNDALVTHRGRATRHMATDSIEATNARDDNARQLLAHVDQERKNRVEREQAP
jgi:hypothetical protein